MDNDEYYRAKVKEFNKAHRKKWHPANNHEVREEPNEKELELTQYLQFSHPRPEAPLVIFGWQYCKSCFDLIARVICEDCLWGDEKTRECTHLTKQPQADPTREMCNWCYFQLCLFIINREKHPQRGIRCDKCQKVINYKGVLTYQNDTIIVICPDCQKERVQEFAGDMLDAARNKIDKDFLAASQGEYVIDN